MSSNRSVSPSGKASSPFEYYIDDMLYEINNKLDENKVEIKQLHAKIDNIEQLLGCIYDKLENSKETTENKLDNMHKHWCE